MTSVLPERTREQRLVDGVTRLIDDYAAVGPNDVCLIAYSPETREYAAHLTVQLGLRGVRTDAFATRPFVDPHVRDRLHARLPARDDLEGRLVVFTMERDSLSHYDVFAEILDLYPKNKLKILRIISAMDELFTTALNRSPRELSLRNATLLRKMSAESTVRVTTPGGSDLTIELDQDRYDWISNRGVWRPGAFVLLPAGEIATYPARVDGVLVADGAINVSSVTRMDTRLGSAPITVQIEDSLATTFHCDRPDMAEVVAHCFAKPHGRRVGELGFGTNDSATEFVWFNSHMNERFPSLHLGFGQHNQLLSNVPYTSEFHLDLITDDADIHFPSTGEVLRMSRFRPIEHIEHPVLMRDQDIFGDCCSSGCAPRTALG